MGLNTPMCSKDHGINSDLNVEPFVDRKFVSKETASRNALKIKWR